MTGSLAHAAIKCRQGKIKLCSQRDIDRVGHLAVQRHRLAAELAVAEAFDDEFEAKAIELFKKFFGLAVDQRAAAQLPGYDGGQLQMADLQICGITKSRRPSRPEHETVASYEWVHDHMGPNK